MKVIYKKLGREKAHGYASSDGVIVIDERLKGKKHLEILIHEAMHLLFPKAEEDEIVKKSIALCKILWKENYRRIDNSKSDPLQDGTK